MNFLCHRIRKLRLPKICMGKKNTDLNRIFFFLDFFCLFGVVLNVFFLKMKKESYTTIPVQQGYRPWWFKVSADLPMSFLSEGGRGEAHWGIASSIQNTAIPKFIRSQLHNRLFQAAPLQAENWEYEQLLCFIENKEISFSSFRTRPKKWNPKNL